jgi:hypothetical protein
VKIRPSKLGRVPSKHDARDLRFAAYRSSSLVDAAPLLRNFTRTPGNAAIRFDVLGNDRYGCCTCAALGHLEWCASAQTGVAAEVTTSIVLAAYDAISEWSQANPTANDNGASCRDALKWFKARGYIRSYVRLDERDHEELKRAVNVGGAVYAAANLPNAAKTQAVWDVPSDGKLSGAFEPGGWGGHAFSILGYDRDGVWIVTWGQIKRATWAWLTAYCDEAWMAIATKWTAGALTPSGFDVERVDADAARLAA